MNGRVIIIGSLNIDTVLEVDSHPRVGETIHAIMATTMPGGKGGNQATAAATAGASVVMVGAVGADGDRYLRHLALCGVDTRLTAVVPGASGAATVIVNARGDNSIIVSEGSNAHVDLSQLERITLTSSDVVSLQFELPRGVVRGAAQWASDAGATLIVNPSPWRRDVDDVLRLADVIVVNELEAAQLGDDALAEKVCITRGPAGAVWGGLSVPAPKIEPVDTTGAGDAFTGTLAALLAQGVEREPALQDAVEAASGACLSSGAQAWRSL